MKEERIGDRNGDDRRIPLQEIARLTNIDNHATVIHSIKTVNNRIDTEQDFKEKIEAIEALINRYNLIVNKTKKNG